MSTISTIPELLLEIFRWLPLKSLIAAQGVNCQWRHLVPLADILPTRRALFDLYINFLASPVFLPTRTTILSDMRPFDRDAFVASLRDGNYSLPDEFLVWLLEWPNKAVIGCIWPGLPPSERNCIGGLQPMTKTITFGACPPTEKVDENILETQGNVWGITGGKVNMRALELVERGCGWSTWVILDGPRKDLIGTLHTLEYGCVSIDFGEDLHPKTWIEWLMWEMGAMEREHEGTDRVLANLEAIGRYHCY